MALYSPSAIPSEPPSSSSSLLRRRKDDVYLSFSCNDTRKNFADPLYEAMKGAGINVFRDDTELKIGESISEELLQAIECSGISVIIFSKDYAASGRCLEEVEKIYGCWKKFQPAVAIIFKDSLEEFGKHYGPSATDKMKGFWSDLSSPRGPQSVNAPPRLWNEYNGDENDLPECVALTLTIVQYFKEYLAMKESGDVENFEEYYKPKYLEAWCRDGCQIGELIVSGQEIARGSNGTIVYEGTYSGRLVAVKRLLKVHRDVAFNEIQNLIESDRYPNIVRLHVKEEDEHFVYLALEQCTCNLADLIHIYSKDDPSQNTQFSREYKDRLESVKNIIGEDIGDINLWKENGRRPNIIGDINSSKKNGRRPSPRLLELMRDVVCGLVYLHKKNIIHWDLKPQNVLINIEEESLRAKLSDMGISKSLQPDMSSLGHHATVCGTSGWQAVEQILGEPQTHAVDLFSLGRVLFFCITSGGHPFGDESFERDSNIVNNQFDLSAVKHIPEAVELFSRLLYHNPKSRPEALQVLLHPLFWDSEKRLSFVRDTSDMVELKARETNSNFLTTLQNIKQVTFGALWNTKMDPKFIAEMEKYRVYNFNRVRGLLRIMRNTLNHHIDLPKEIQEILGSVPEGVDDYFATQFPNLLIEVYKVVFHYCLNEEWLQKYLKFNV